MADDKAKAAKQYQTVTFFSANEQVEDEVNSKCSYFITFITSKKEEKKNVSGA